MFVAVNTSNRARVTSISSEWDGQVEALRDMTSNGELVCQGCEQLLWLRTGEKRRRHFAHRTLKDCPLAKKSPEVLEAQFHLYRWLDGRYPGKVELDLAPPGANGPAIVDIHVKIGSEKTVLFWIFDRQQRNRQWMIDSAQLPGMLTQFVHTESTLKLHSDDEIALTASQRDFIVCSDFDRSVGMGYRGHHYFLNSKDGTLSVFRGLRCVHAPNLFGWQLKREFQVMDAELQEETGEIVCAEDLTDLMEWREAITHEVNSKSKMLHKWQETVESEDALKKDALIFLTGPFRCEDCGEMTSDWTSSKPGAGTCVCRRCNEMRWRDKDADAQRGDVV